MLYPVSGPLCLVVHVTTHHCWFAFSWLDEGEDDFLLERELLVTAADLDKPGIYSANNNSKIKITLH